MRITITLCAAMLAAGPAIAKEGDPIAGVGVSESSTGGIIARFNNVAEAQAACTTAGGTFTTANNRIVCTNSSRQPRSAFHQRLQLIADHAIPTTPSRTNAPTVAAPSPTATPPR